MRKILLLALLLSPLAALAQIGSPVIQLVGSAPSGSCTQNLPDQQVATTGALYSCQNGTWVQIGSGGGVPTSSAEVFNGISMACNYTGSTADVKLAAATSDAINKTNGNTTGLVDASCLGGNQTFSATGVFGDSNNDQVGYILPCGVYWTYSGSGGAGFIWYGGATLISPCASNGNQLQFTINSSTATYVMEAIGGGNRPYLYGHGFQILNTSSNPTTSGIGFYINGQFADGSTLDLVNVYDSEDTTKAEVYGACCEFTWTNSSINGAFTGSNNLLIYTDSGNFTRDFTFSYGSIVHPGTGGFDVNCTDTRNSTVSSFNMNNLYVETGNSSNPSALVLINGCSHATVQNVHFIQYGSVGFPGVYVTNAYNTFLEADNFWFDYGSGPWSTPTPAVVNAYTNQNIPTDANGYFHHYVTPSATSTLDGAQQPGDLVYAGTGELASRLPGNTTTNDEVLVSTGTQNIPSPSAYTCSNYTASGSSVTCTWSTAVGSGNYVVVGLSNYEDLEGFSGVTDSAGDTYLPIGSVHTSTSISGLATQFYWFGPTTTTISSVTANETGGNNLIIQANASSNLGSVDGSPCYADTSATTAVSCGTPLVTSNPNDYIFCDAHNATGGDNFSAGSGFTQGSSYNGNNMAQYKVQTAAGSFTPSITSSGADPAAMACVAFSATTTSAAPTLKNNPALSTANMSATALKSGTSSNSDSVGVLTLSGGTQTYSFAGTYTTAPVCTTQDRTTATNASHASATTTVLTVTGTGTDAVGYICIGLN